MLPLSAYVSYSCCLSTSLIYHRALWRRLLPFSASGRDPGDSRGPGLRPSCEEAKNLHLRGASPLQHLVGEGGERGGLRPDSEEAPSTDAPQASLPSSSGATSRSLTVRCTPRSGSGSLAAATGPSTGPRPTISTSPRTSGV